MKYSLEFLQNKSLESEDGFIEKESTLDGLLLRLDAEKYVSLVFMHANSNILTVSGGNQTYIIMFSDSNRFYELSNPAKRGGERLALRTGHTVGKFPSEMIIDPFTALNVIKEFFKTGKRLSDLNWMPLI